MINRKRKQVHCVPVVPNSRNGFAISEECARTLGGEKFFLYDSVEQDEEHILIFGTRMMVDLLSRYHHWFVNGTFSITPNIFYQVFTVHVLVNDVLVSYSLPIRILSEQSQRDLKTLLEWVHFFTQNLQPETILTNFELASIQAIQERFPEAAISRCFFHLGQSLWRHVQVSELYHFYANDDDIRANIKSLLALAFLPVNDVSNAFDELVVSLFDEFQVVASYFENTYVRRRM